MTVVAVQHGHIDRVYVALHNMSQPCRPASKEHFGDAEPADYHKNAVTNGMHS